MRRIYGLCGVERTAQKKKRNSVHQIHKEKGLGGKRYVIAAATPYTGNTLYISVSIN